MYELNKNIFFFFFFLMHLQNYLIKKGYLGADSATGYYGFLTAQAVGKLQVTLGIVSSNTDTAYGLLGPKTRAAIACGATTPPPPQQPSSQPSATIDQSSLISTSNPPRITGSAYNTSRIGLSIGLGGEKFDGTGTRSVVNNRWSVPLYHKTYMPGTYSIDVYDGSNNLLTSFTP